MNDTSEVQCPYCYELVDLYVDPETTGSFVEDCAVCCRPWAITASRQPDGQLILHVARAQ